MPFLVALGLVLFIAGLLMHWRYGLGPFSGKKALPPATAETDQAKAERLVVVLFGDRVLSAVDVNQALDELMKIEISKEFDWSAFKLTWEDVLVRAKFKSLEWFREKVCEAVCLTNKQTAHSRKESLLVLLGRYGFVLGDLELDSKTVEIFDHI